jgi:hypothetical protein
MGGVVMVHLKKEKGRKKLSTHYRPKPGEVARV